MRDDFAEEVKRTLAARVGNRCSNPTCCALTSGPQDDPTKALNVGVAAHITAAAQGGPRYDSLLTSEERCHPDNGIWLCQTCAKLVDNDTSQFAASLLRAWKTIAEHAARSTIGKTASSDPTSTKLWGEVPEVKKSPKLVWSAFQFVDATMDRESGIWREKWEQYSTKAFVFHFRNEVYDGGGGESAIVKAQLSWEYKHGAVGVTFSPGAWMDEPCGVVEIPVGWSKKLIIGIRNGPSGTFYWDGYSNPRIKSTDTHRLDGQPIPYDGFLTIKLIGATNEIWFEGRFRWTEDLQHQSHPSVTRLS